MENAFKKLVKENKEKIEKYTNELKEAGFTDSDIQDCRDIYNLKNMLTFEESDNGVCKDYEISYWNGYERGLYKGAKKKKKKVIDRLIKDKVGKVISNKNIDLVIVSATKKLYIAEAVKREIILKADAYDENIAVVGKDEFQCYTHVYCIVARKDKYMKDYEYLMIDSDGLHQDYKPTETEMELFK